MDKKTLKGMAIGAAAVLGLMLLIAAVIYYQHRVKPVDQLTQDLRSLYIADDTPDKATHVKALAEFYRGPAKADAADESLTTTARLYERLRTDVKKAVPDSALRPLRTRIGAEFCKVLPCVDATLTAEDRAKAAAVFETVANALSLQDFQGDPEMPQGQVKPGAIGSFGWLEAKAPAVAAQILPTLKGAYFSDAAKKLIQSAEEKDALLYQAAIRVTGKTLPAHDQDGVGSCVGEGGSGSVELLQCVEIAINGEHSSYKPVSAAAAYALSREAGGMLGGGDGSTGSAMAKALEKMGSVSCQTAGDTNGVDGTAQTHAALAKKWGRTGLPAELKADARKHLIKSVALVRSADEIKVALQNGYPVFVCSNVGFEGNGGYRRDADGRVYRGGNWAHCMYIAGYRADRQWFCLVNSWGPQTPPGPKTLGQPDGSGWITKADMDAIARQGDSYAISQHDGWPAQKIDWIVQLAPKREPVVKHPWRQAFLALAP